MLYEAQLVFEDQVASLLKDSKKQGTQGGDVDFALLVDGLAAEREQGITIDVAYRFFGTDHRKFIVADTPGHEQYTRNAGDRCFHRRCCGHIGRRVSGCAYSDSTSFIFNLTAGHSQCCVGNQQNGPGGF